MAELLEKAAVSYNNHCSAGTQLKMLSFYSKKKIKKKCPWSDPSKELQSNKPYMCIWQGSENNH